MLSWDDKEIIKSLDKSDGPYVCEDGLIVNLDLVTASKLAGVKLVCGRDGKTIFRERRRGRCVFCGGKKCMDDPDYIVPFGLESTDHVFIEVYSCRSKAFLGKKYMRYIANITARLGELTRKKKLNICPVCGSGKLVRLNGTKCTKKTELRYRVICKTCGFKGW